MKPRTRNRECAASFGAGVTSPDADREPCWSFIGSENRRFTINGLRQGVQLLSGSTSDLEEPARAAAGWRSCGPGRHAMDYDRRRRRARNHPLQEDPAP
ncbi:hypothetical protein CP978_30920 [Streptomyces nodosus]|uniref:Uncharacterized protein n=1 Tax=Streptomyces nodosus TaxID=40318 RepID=A0A5P2W9R0_9ACTN|nr:hypothetical protein CP978_30920 [Streptomyces nodosus]